MNTEFWRDRRVLITGHTGFKGSWLCLWLDMLGAKVCGYALEPPTDPCLFRLAAIDELVDSTIGDIADLAKVSSLIISFAPDIIIHMAAQTVVLDSYENPVETYATNVLGTVHILEAVRRAGLRCSIVNVTTDKCYENRGWTAGYKESDRLGGRDPYSNSKACSEFVSHAYRESFFPVAQVGEHGVIVASARAGNVVGGGDWTPWQLIPDVVTALSHDEKVILRHPDAIRPWQHVLDCLSGYLTLAEKLSTDPEEFSGGWNFGPADGDARPVSYVVETIGKRWGVDDPWVLDQGTHSHEEPLLMLDSTRANEILGWHPRLTLDSALEWVADWYMAFLADGQAREISRDQISHYLVD